MRILVFKPHKTTLNEEPLEISSIKTDLFISKSKRETIPDPGVEAPLNRAFGSNSKPRFFLMDLRFLLEKPKL